MLLIGLENHPRSLQDSFPPWSPLNASRTSFCLKFSNHYATGTKIVDSGLPQEIPEVFSNLDDLLDFFRGSANSAITVLSE